jgi:hypothetical protein
MSIFFFWRHLERWGFKWGSEWGISQLPPPARPPINTGVSAQKVGEWGYLVFFWLSEVGY